VVFPAAGLRRYSFRFNQFVSTFRAFSFFFCSARTQLGQDPALPLDPKVCAPMQPILRVLAQLDNAYVRQDAAASTTNTKAASAASASSSPSAASSSSSATSPSVAAAAPATPETIAIAPVPKKKTVFSLTSSSESLLHYYPTRRTLRLLLSAIDVRYTSLLSGVSFFLLIRCFFHSQMTMSR
jgi:hypothetical protein